MATSEVLPSSLEQTIPTSDEEEDPFVVKLWTSLVVRVLVPHLEIKGRNSSKDQGILFAEK
jgi:hypothetical protein